ncbi:MAG: NAD(P)H-dependent oxidoreductase [Dokdonella sp.]
MATKKSATRKSRSKKSEPSPPAKYNDLRALFLNCTLKRSSDGESHTDKLMQVSAGVMRANGVKVSFVRPVDLDLAPGVQPDMTKHGFDKDDWPALRKKVMAADILVLGTPIWLGDPSSVCRRTIERLYAESGKFNEKGQYIYYGRVAGCIVTGNEDGIKHCAMNLLYSLQHLGYTIPPQADAGWIGEAGPGPSYGDDGIGFDNDFTQRNTTFAAWNLMHLARLLKDGGGIPAHGNQPEQWKAGCRFDHPNPEYRG